MKKREKELLLLVQRGGVVREAHRAGEKVSFGWECEGFKTNPPPTLLALEKSGLVKFTPPEVPHQNKWYAMGHVGGRYELTDSGRAALTEAGFMGAATP